VWLFRPLSELLGGHLDFCEKYRFYAVCTKKPIYAHYIQECIEVKDYIISDTGNNFLISYYGEIICVYFETRIVDTGIPSALSFAYNVLTEMLIFSLAYGIVYVKNRVTFLTCEVLTSLHDCVSNLFDYNLNAPMELAGSKVYNR
jgi:hypothetical protein